MSTHTGTHVDAPSHFVPGGRTVERYRLEPFVAHARVWDLHHRPARAPITARDLQHAARTRRVRRREGVLIRTDWSRRQGTPQYLHDYPGLDAAAAAYLVRLGVGLVGVDSPNIDQAHDARFPVHKALLARGIPIVENLGNLRRLPAKPFRLLALPLRLRGATGSPIRAVALIEGSG